MTPDTSPAIVKRLDGSLQPIDVFRRVAHLEHSLFLDSARQDATLGRYSFLAVQPFEVFSQRAGQPDALSMLESRLAQLSAETIPGLPPFQGGAAGYFGYELGGTLEQLPKTRFDEFDMPLLTVGLYDLVVAFDLKEETAWLISQGFPETDPERRRIRAQQRMQELETLLASDPPAWELDVPDRIPSDQLAPQYATDDLPELTSNFQTDDYQQAVQKAIDYVYAGDIFQVNVSQRLLYPQRVSSPELYCRLRTENPAPFAAYFDAGQFQVVSSSPERFVKISDGQVETRPIKGTRRRSMQPEADLFAGDDLRASEKDRAENVMIVDLLRNDLSRVCKPDSIRVTQLCEVEIYQYVQHLVSAIIGQLAPGRSAIDLLRATFPGGSITGAPKIRAMEIIAELEPTARGPYCGCLGYVGFDGTTDLNILIRTVTAGRGWWQLPVGGGIVAQSTPQSEYEETWHKARGIVRTLACFKDS